MAFTLDATAFFFLDEEVVGVFFFLEVVAGFTFLADEADLAFDFFGTAAFFPFAVFALVAPFLALGFLLDEGLGLAVAFEVFVFPEDLLAFFFVAMIDSSLSGQGI